MQRFLQDVPHLVTANRNALLTLEKQLLLENSRIEEWLSQQFQLTPPPPYCSVDLRNAGFKIAPVDTNLFPAGFNNLHSELYPHAIAASRKLLERVAPHCQQVLIIPENHTRNIFYFESLATLQWILQQAGFRSRLGTLLPEITTVKTIELPSQRTLQLEPLQRNGQRLGLKDFDPHLILLNLDLAEGIPDILKNLEQTIIPPLELGWSSRLKSQHFFYYQQVVDEFAQFLQIDPWLMEPWFTTADNVDFVKREGEEELVEKTTQLMQKIQGKYKEYNIDHQPYVVIKADAGTYGMGILPIQDPQQIKALNRKQRSRMATTKGDRAIRKVIIQEGVYTFETWGEDNAVAEPVIYMIGEQVIGGFYRVHNDRGVDENLNAPGMHFASLPFAQSCDCPQQQSFEGCDNRFYVYGVIARLALVAAAREVEAVCRKKSG